MRYDGYGTSSFGGGLLFLFLVLVLGGVAFAVMYILAHLDSIKSALFESVRHVMRGATILALFAAGGIATAAGLVLHEPSLADDGKFYYLAAFMALMLGSAYRLIRWIIRMR